MSKTKNNRKLRKRKGGDPVSAPPAGLGTAPAPAPGTGTAPGTGLGPAPGTGLGPAPAAPPAAPPAAAPAAAPAESSIFTPPVIDPVPQRPPGPPGPVGPAPVPPPKPSFFEKLFAPFTSKKKEVETPQTNEGGWFSNSKVSILSPSTWFGGKSRRHGKNKKSKANKKTNKKTNKKKH